MNIVYTYKSSFVLNIGGTYISIKPTIFGMYMKNIGYKKEMTILIKATQYDIRYLNFLLSLPKVYKFKFKYFLKFIQMLFSPYWITKDNKKIKKLSYKDIVNHLKQIQNADSK